MIRAALLALAVAGCVSLPPVKPPPPPPPVPAPPPVPPPPPDPHPTTSPVTFGQAFDAHVPNAAAMPYAAFVWSDNGKLAARFPGPVYGLYTAAYRIKEPIANLPPVCVAVKADGSPAWEFGDLTEAPFDFTNPMCVELKEEEIMAMLGGQTVLAIDNIDVHNSYGITGTRSDPHRYTGGPDDPAWVADDLIYVQTITTFAHSKGLTVWINDAGGSTAIKASDWANVATLVDGVAQEGFPLDACYSDDSWRVGRALGAQFDKEYGEVVSQTARPVWLADYLCTGLPADAANAGDVTYALATYLLAWKPGNLLSLSTAALSGYPVAYPASMSPLLGKPLGPPPAPGSRPYVRRFEGGTVTVDAVAGTASIRMR